LPPRNRDTSSVASVYSDTHLQLRAGPGGNVMVHWRTLALAFVSLPSVAAAQGTLAGTQGNTRAWRREPIANLPESGL